jgi:hypothetical protein
MASRGNRTKAIGFTPEKPMRPVSEKLSRQEETMRIIDVGVLQCAPAAGISAANN